MANPTPAPLPASLPSAIPDWVNWVAVGATIIGLIVSVVGLIATYRQAREAKDASIAAKDAALSAVDTLKKRDTFYNIASIISQIQIIKYFINSDEILAARVSFNTCSGLIKQVFYNMGIKEFNNSSDYADGIEKSMKELTASFDLVSLTPQKKISIVRVLSDISERMSSEEAKRKWTL